MTKTKTAKTAFAGFGTACALALAGALSVAPAPARAQSTGWITFAASSCTAAEADPVSCFLHANGVGTFGETTNTPPPNFGIPLETQQAVYGFGFSGEFIDMRVTATGVIGFPAPLGVEDGVRGIGVGENDAYITNSGGIEESIWLSFSGFEEVALAAGRKLGQLEFDSIRVFGTPQAGDRYRLRIRAYDVPEGGIANSETEVAEWDYFETIGDGALRTISTSSSLRGNVFQIVSQGDFLEGGFSLAGVRFTYLPGEIIPLPPAVWGLGASLALFGAVAYRRRRAKS